MTDGTDDAWNVGGVLISRKIDVVAFAAFFLSIATIIIQLSNYFKGARLNLLPPDQVFFRRVADYTDGKPRARFGATLIYVNEGEKGYAAIVRRELMYITIAGKNFEQGWDDFVTYDGFVPKDGGEPAKPFAVDGSETKTHQTDFIPWPKHCPTSIQGQCDVQENHVRWDALIGELERQVSRGQRVLEFKFAAELIGTKTITTSCKIDIDESVVGAIKLASGYNPTCFSDQAHQMTSDVYAPPLIFGP